MSTGADSTSYIIQPNEQAVHIGLIGAGGYGEIHNIRNMQTQQCFARKLLRAFAGNISEDDIRNEARAIDKLCKSSHDNVINVINHGRFNPTSVTYFIDMELCNINLEEYIQGKKVGIRGLIDWETAGKEEQRQFLIIAIMQQLLSGLAFIHDHDEVHRDMAPQNVLYSANSGWWKIADFGLTSSGTSQHLRSTTAKRGRASYRAPEMVRDTGTGYNKKVDIWSLGCILYEICTGKKAFKDDFDTFQFSAAKKEFVTEFPSWFEPNAAEQYGPLIREMLHSEHEKRPSIKKLCKSFGRLISFVSLRSGDEIQTQLNDEYFFFQSKYLLGTDVLSEEALQNVRWDKGLPGGTSERNVQSTQRWRRLIEARKVILGVEHINTIWAIISLAWNCIFIGDPDQAISSFMEAFGIIQKSKGLVHNYTLSIQYGLAWAYSNAGEHKASDTVFAEIFSTYNQSVNPSSQRILSTRCAWVRNDLFWRPREELIPKLVDIINRQKNTLGNDHVETIESISLLASAYFLQRGNSSSLNAVQLFNEAFSTSKRLFGIEHPAILSLCGLIWSYARLQQTQEATRIFHKVEEAQKDFLGGEYPSTTFSLTELAVALSRGPISWTPKPQSQLQSNNPYGARGANKCINCRRRKIRCEYNDSSEPCRYCVQQSLECGPKFRSTRAQSNATVADSTPSSSTAVTTPSSIPVTPSTMTSVDEPLKNLDEVFRNFPQSSSISSQGGEANPSSSRDSDSTPPERSYENQLETENGGNPRKRDRSSFEQDTS